MSVCVCVRVGVGACENVVCVPFPLTLINYGSCRVFFKFKYICAWAYYVDGVERRKKNYGVFVIIKADNSRPNRGKSKTFTHHIPGNLMHTRMPACLPIRIHFFTHSSHSIYSIIFIQCYVLIQSSLVSIESFDLDFIISISASLSLSHSHFLSLFCGLQNSNFISPMKLRGFHVLALLLFFYGTRKSTQ